MELSGLFAGGTLQRLLAGQPLFPMIRVRQQLPDKRISPEALPARVRKCLDSVLPAVWPGMRIGIAVGSRGIDGQVHVLSLLVRALRGRGAACFIVPCMGSHGNNAAGQAAILAGLGITEATVGAPVRSGDEVVSLPAAAGGAVAYIDRFLLDCDGIVAVNRVKPHTAFRGPVESGLSKMLAVGVGKQKGAAACHSRGFEGMADRVVAAARTVLATGKFLFGLALLENAAGQLCELEAVPAAEIPTREPVLLERARALCPSLPFERLDLLIVDELGKDVSGSGMDTNVIGRYPTPGMTGGPDIRQLVALSLTPASEGSGHGMGFADIVSARLLAALDLEKTYPNGLTNLTTAPAKLPPVMPDDKTAIQAATRCCMLEDVGAIRAVRIKNTHRLGELYVSPALLDRAIRPLVRLGEAAPLQFDRQGTLLPGWDLSEPPSCAGGWSEG